jgi:ESX secretion-associated protein EspD/H
VVSGTDFSSASWEDDDAESDDDPWETADSSDDGELVTTLLFTATNPPGTVSVTAVMDGRIVRVDLSPGVTRMTESQLAEEITVISKIAGRQALAAQHALAAGVMRKLGHDSAATRAYLERELGLPSLQTVLTEKLGVFKARYAEEHD